MTRADFPLVSRWLDQPHVQQWWVGEDADPSAVERKYGPRIDGAEPTEMFIISSDGQPIGMIQRYRIEDYPDWARPLAAITDVTNAAGIDPRRTAHSRRADPTIRGRLRADVAIPTLGRNRRRSAGYWPLGCALARCVEGPLPGALRWTMRQ